MKPITLLRVVSCAAALLALVSTRPAVAQCEEEGYCTYYDGETPYCAPCGVLYSCDYYPPAGCEGEGCYISVPCVTQHFAPGQPPVKFDFGTGHAIKFTTHVLQDKGFDLTVLFVPIMNGELFDRLNEGLGPADCIPYDGATSNSILGNCGFYHVDNPPEKGVDYSGNVTATVWWDFPTLDPLNNVRLYRAPLDGSDNSCLQDFDCYTQDITNAVYAFGDSSNPDPGVRGTATGFSDFEAVDLTSPTSAAARVWIGLKKSNDSGIRFDLKAVVKKNGNPVSSGELLGAPGGGKGFGNANLLTIPLSLPANAFHHGDNISVKLFVRNSCLDSPRNSGSARLWYNDAAANSRVDEPGAPTLYLVRGDDDGEEDCEHDEDGGDLSKNAGNGPKKKKNVHVNAPVPLCDGPYKSFGKWSGTVR